jgi:hypothetical protein
LARIFFVEKACVLFVDERARTSPWPIYFETSLKLKLDAFRIKFGLAGALGSKFGERKE